MIGIVVVHPDGRQHEIALLNQMMNYTYEQAKINIDVREFQQESIMCQEFFRLLNKIANDNESVVLAIAHNGSASPRGDPYDLPWIAYRSLYNLNIV